MVEAITEPELDLGESPVWDDRIGRLYWVDINAGDLMWLDWGTGANARSVGLSCLSFTVTAAAAARCTPR